MQENKRSPIEGTKVSLKIDMLEGDLISLKNKITISHTYRVVRQGQLSVF